VTNWFLFTDDVSSAKNVALSNGEDAYDFGGKKEMVMVF
jgi:hypothetical protein